MPERPRVAIVTDSTADLPHDLRTHLGIAMVPLNVHIGTDTYRDQVDLSTAQFMELLRTSTDFPTTSQPASGLFEQTFRELAETHDEAVCILISSRLSGTVQSAQIAADAVRDVIRVEVVDSMNGSLGSGFQVLEAHRLAAAGERAEEIAMTLRGRTNRYHVIFFVNTLDHLRRGGRIGKAASLVGSMLKLKPLLRLDEGQVVPFERTRTRRKATDALVEFAENLPGIERIAVLHNTTPDDAEALYDRVKHLGKQDPDVRIAELSPVLGTHVGPDILGLAIEVGASE